MQDTITQLINQMQETDAALAAMKAIAKNVSESAPVQEAVTAVRAHAPNITTYLLIVAVIVLQVAIRSTDWLIAQLDRTPEYVIQLQLAKFRAQRFLVRLAIRAEQFHLTVAPRVTAAMDRVFCLS